MNGIRLARCCLAALLAAALLAASSGCIEGGRRGGDAGRGGLAMSFLKAPSGLEVKKMTVDARGVLWVLTYSRDMYSLDPDLYLAALPVCGSGVEDFALEGSGGWEDLANGSVYLASGEEGLQRMDRAGGRVREPVPGIAVSVYADLSGGVYAGSGDGVFQRTGQGWEKIWEDAGDSPGTPVRMARAAEGLVCEIWENRLELLVPGETRGQPLQVSGESSFRVVELEEMPSGEVYLVTSQGVYRLEGREFAAVRRSNDPIISAARIGAEDLLLGKNSGALTRLSPSAGTEEALASLEEPVERVSASTREEVYAQCASGIYFSSDLVREPERLVARAGFEAESGPFEPGGIRLTLPSSDFLDPEWFYYEVKAGTDGLSWELEHEGSSGLVLALEGVSGRVKVETLAAASRSDDFGFDPGDLYPFPSSFPEEARPYLQPMAGAPGDLPAVTAVLEGIPAEDRGDMLAVLLHLTRSDLFYLTACEGRDLPPPSLSGAESAEYVRRAVTRVLEGEGGDDYARALAFAALCRAAGIPARTALSFDRYLDQVYVYGVGWVPVDVSRPVFDFLAPSYPAVGSLPGGGGSFVTGTGGVDDGLTYAEAYRAEDAVTAGEAPGEATVIFCRPSSFRLRDPSEAVSLGEGASFYFEERGGEILLVRDTPGGREKTPVYQDHDSLTLAEGFEVSLRLVEERYVVVEVLRSP